MSVRRTCSTSCAILITCGRSDGADFICTAPKQTVDTASEVRISTGCKLQALLQLLRFYSF